jgi:hypothetical protein
MRPKTTTALALAGMAAAAPAAYAAAPATDPPSPVRTALRAPLGDHLTVAAQMRAARYAELREDLTARALRVARREDVSPRAERRRLQGRSPAELRSRIRALRRPDPKPAPTASPVLEAIAQCESGGDPTTDTGNGFYGKYQFDLQTWASVGGTGNPAAASEAEQDRRAAILYARAGAAPWPMCGR